MIGGISKFSLVFDWLEEKNNGARRTTRTMTATMWKLDMVFSSIQPKKIEMITTIKPGIRSRGLFAFVYKA